MNIYTLIEKMTLEHKTIFDMQLRVAFYARVSTTKEVQLNSRDNQIQTFTELIQKNSNWTLIKGYVDTVRGETAANRNNFMRMIDDAKLGKFDLIVCKEISRFSRDLIDSISYTRELFKNNVGVYFTSDNLCTIDRDSELRLGIMASIAQQEVARLSERIKFGHKKAIENGVVMGNSRIFGYIKNDGKLVIDPYESKMVEKIFQMYSTGDYSLRNISEELYKMGYKNHSGNMIAHTTIKAIIKNPKYKGYYCGNKVKVLDYRTKEQKFLPEESWIVYKDETGEKVPAIISEEIWDRCNAMLKTRCTGTKGNIGGKRFTSPLSSKIFCTHCGKNYHHDSYGHKNGKDNVQWHWICSEKKKRTSNCPSFSIKDDDMLKIIKNFLVSFIGDMDKYIGKYVTVYKSQFANNKIQETLKSIETEIKKYQNKKDKLLDLYTDEIISKEDFKIKNEKIQAHLDELNREKESLCGGKHSIEKYISQLKDIKEYFNNSNVTVDNMSDTFAYELSKTIIKRIEIEPIDKITANIVFYTNFSDNFKMSIAKECRGKANCSSMTNGNISLMMIPLVTMKFTYSFLRNQPSITKTLNLKLKM